MKVTSKTTLFTGTPAAHTLELLIIIGVIEAA